MKVSIVTISFNQVDYLRAAIESVLSQDYHAIEYIVVDPGSTDGSRELIDSYGDKVIRIFEKDTGPANGLNNGFGAATGDIFGFLNSDDILRPGAISSVCAYFKRAEGADVVSGHSDIINENGAVIRRIYSDKYNLLFASYGASILSQPSTFFRRHYFDAVNGFNEANKSNWDGELFIDMALAGARFDIVDSIMSGYRLHSEGITGTGRLEQMHRAYDERVFEKIRGRPKNKVDNIVGALAKRIRQIRNYKDTLERIKYGPVFGAKG